MSQEFANLVKETNELGVKLFLLEELKEAKECFSATAEKGDLSAKVLLLGFLNFSYDKIALSENEIETIKTRGNAPTATAEDLRNLGLYYLRINTNEANGDYETAYSLLIDAADKNDPFALHYISTHNYQFDYIKKHKNLMPVDDLQESLQTKYNYCEKASQAGSWLATSGMMSFYRYSPECNEEGEELPFIDFAKEEVHSVKCNLNIARLKAFAPIYKLNAKFNCNKLAQFPTVRIEQSEPTPKTIGEELAKPMTTSATTPTITSATAANIVKPPVALLPAVQLYPTLEKTTETPKVATLYPGVTFPGMEPKDLEDKNTTLYVDSRTYTEYVSHTNVAPSMGKFLATVAPAPSHEMNTMQFNLQFPSVPTTPIVPQYSQKINRVALPG